MTISVVVPTYRRTKSLKRCLGSLKNQARGADEVLVVVRDEDKETHDFLGSSNFKTLNIRTVIVDRPGQVAAWNAGLNATRGEIVAFTDDDAAPHPDWLEKIERCFLSDEKIGGVGGRDVIYLGDKIDEGQRKEEAGKLKWFGLLVGNHHLGVGGAREVDHLKGVNMSYKRAAIEGIRFDEGLRGAGAQFMNDSSFSLAVRRAGWKLIYDPDILVDHYVGIRPDETRIHSFNADLKDVFDGAYNEAWVLLKHLGVFRKAAYLIWSFFVGTRLNPGLVQAFRFTPGYGIISWKRFISVQKGKLSAVKAYVKLNKNMIHGIF